MLEISYFPLPSKGGLSEGVPEQIFSFYLSYDPSVGVSSCKKPLTEYLNSVIKLYIYSTKIVNFPNILKVGRIVHIFVNYLISLGLQLNWP